MGQLFIPAEREIKGPWFIGINELEELHDIFEFIDNKIDESIDLEIQELAEADFQRGYYKNIETSVEKNTKYYAEKKVKRVVLISSDEKRLIDNSVKGLLRDSKLNDFYPKELYLDIEHRYNSQFSLKIKRRFDGEISYKVKCFDQECNEEIKYKIESWLEKHQPNKAKQIWSEFAFLFIIISLLCALISSLNIITSELPDFKTIYKNEIEEIIKVGVNKENGLKSIDLLLKFITDYKPDSIKEIHSFNKISIQIFLLSIFILIISIFRPKTTIGIGKHKSLNRFYKIYTNFILITFPLTFFVPPLIELLKKYL